MSFSYEFYIFLILTIILPSFCKQASVKNKHLAKELLGHNK